MMTDFALVLPEETVHALSEGRIQGKVGVCTVKGGEAVAYVAWPGSVAALVGTLPVTPSTAGHRVALPDVSDETEALDVVLEAIRNEEGRIVLGTPAGFVESAAVHAHGLAMMFGEEGLDVRVSKGLAARLGWREGDAVRIAMSSDGATAAIHCDEEGGQLVPTARSSGGLEVASYLIVPFKLRNLTTDWFSPAYWVSGGRIFLDVSEIPQPSVEEDETSDENYRLDAEPSARSERFVDGFLVGGALAAAFAGLSYLI
jgi:putative hemolysin